MAVKTVEARHVRIGDLLRCRAGYLRVLSIAKVGSEIEFGLDWRGTGVCQSSCVAWPHEPLTIMRPKE